MPVGPAASVWKALGIKSVHSEIPNSASKVPLYPWQTCQVLSGLEFCPRPVAQFVCPLAVCSIPAAQQGSWLLPVVFCL